MRKISADLIITNDGAPLENGILITDDKGLIFDILSSDSSMEGVETFRGIITPGFVNAHCHLELSHLKNVIPTGTGLIPFIKGVVSLRDFPEEVIQEAINAADKEMWDNGIVAVGDISNKVDTASAKGRSFIRYYTFVEMFDFLQEANALSTFEQYKEVYEQQDDSGHNKKSYVPHAPYSVSKSLFEYVNEQNQPGSTISIHNQELTAENEFFLRKEGGFIDFYKDFGIPLDAFDPIGRNSIHYTFQNVNPHFKTLMVHNTMTSKEDITFAHAWNQETYWVSCPNANLYIENRLPRYKDFIYCDAKVCLGTDSLSSNWSLSIFEEMKTIKKYQSDIDDLLLVKWATINGARALGYYDLGILKKDLQPGILHIDVPCQRGSFNLNEAIKVTRVI